MGSGTAALLLRPQPVCRAVPHSPGIHFYHTVPRVPSDHVGQGGLAQPRRPAQQRHLQPGEMARTHPSKNPQASARGWSPPPPRPQAAGSPQQSRTRPCSHRKLRLQNRRKLQRDWGRGVSALTIPGPQNHSLPPRSILKMGEAHQGINSIPVMWKAHSRSYWRPGASKPQEVNLPGSPSGHESIEGPGGLGNRPGGLTF